jgi:hypothetical protein
MDVSCEHSIETPASYKRNSKTVRMGGGACAGRARIDEATALAYHAAGCLAISSGP